ncbi:MAG: hypothetical protein V3V01_12695 [Acidimicrobiales bacterium]
MTARWVVDIAEERDLKVEWKPISLLFKNETQPDSDHYEAVKTTHGMLRVMESVRAEVGSGPIKDYYFQLGARIHHDKNLDFDIADALTAAGLDPAHAAAADDESFDVAIRESMDDGLGLAGNDIGTPLIAKVNSKGVRSAYFGPVITRVPDHDDALKLWDALGAMMDIDGFWELKRTRTESPEFGKRP